MHAIRPLYFDCLFFEKLHYIFRNVKPIPQKNIETLPRVIVANMMKFHYNAGSERYIRLKAKVHNGIQEMEISIPAHQQLPNIQQQFLSILQVPL
jgi:hypothetical protein